ncbi:MAG: NAD(+)/NADH kinase [Myxococcales bacterium]|nr:NAD(+)/NADH kinase [Myxococcales bacterium]
MKLQRVLVIYKKSVYQLYVKERGEKKYIRALEAQPTALARAMEAHYDNERTLERVQAALTKRGIDFRCAYRARKQAIEGVDLVITVGGDGTLLDTSHAVDDIPVLGVNSSPKYSVGHFCTAIADTIDPVLDEISAGRLPLIAVQRLRVSTGDITPAVLALNEVLFAHPSPAGTSRYELFVNGDHEEQKSSGVWIATAAGSTAAIRSAGGAVVPLDSLITQYWVREPYFGFNSPLRLLGGTFEGPIEIVSRLRTSMAYIDGHRMQLPLGYGETLRITLADRPLYLFRHTEGEPHAQSRELRGVRL